MTQVAENARTPSHAPPMAAFSRGHLPSRAVAEIILGRWVFWHLAI